MPSNCNTIKYSESFADRHESKTGEKASVLGVAMANIALASVILGSMYFVSDLQKKHTAQADSGEAVVQSTIAPDSLANRAVNKVKALTEIRQITIKNEAPMDVVLPEGVTPQTQTIEIETEIAPELEKTSEIDIKPLKSSEAEAKAYIFRRESSNRLEAENKYGCKGLGQDCNGRLVVECPNWKTDRKCQEEFFGKYVTRRYGDWETAKIFWDARVPIKGRDVGNWY